MMKGTASCRSSIGPAPQGGCPMPSQLLPANPGESLTQLRCAPWNCACNPRISMAISAVGGCYGWVMDGGG